jgi:PAS domain S-box-containing protein
MVPKIRKIVAIAEDSPTQAEELKYILEKNGYKVLHGLNGQEVMKLVRKDRPLLIITDILMPVMDGYELCRRIKTDEDLSKVPVILLTSLTHMEDVLKGLECGADSYVMKPFNEEHLMSRIYSVLNSKATEDDEIMEQENVDVLFEGKKYLVNSTRFQILNMLLSTYEGAVQKTRKLIKTQAQLSNLRVTLEKKVEEKTADLQIEITEHEEVEMAIKASERKYRNLVENALVGVFGSTFQGQFQFVNMAFCAILQYDSAEKLISQSLKSLFKSSNDYRVFLEELRKNNQVKNYELELVSLPGHTRWVIVNALLKGDYLSGMILDITERKKSEMKEIENQEELRIAKEKAEESDRLKSAFLANMSHEIRTPMNTILGFSSLLTDSNISAENRKNFTNQISENCYNLLNLIENILNVAKLEAGKLKLYKKECFLNRLLTDIYTVVVHNHKYKNKNHISLNMQAAIQDKNFSIFTDPVRLQQILLNLLDNAFKFTENGTIGFGYTVHGNILQFFVKDTGIGLAENQKEIVFDSFRKVEDTKTKLYGGAGLGLAICKKLITLFDGKIWVEAERGKGSAFYFTIPLKVVKKPVIVSEEKAAAGKSHSLKDKKILVAEDDLLNYKLIEAILSKSDATLFWARDGMEAVELIKSGKDFDLVLMDLRMPNMDGFQAAREIRGLKKSLPVVAVSAYSLGDEKDLAFLSGFDDYLTKPVNQEMLLNAVNKYVCEGVA